MEKRRAAELAKMEAQLSRIRLLAEKTRLEFEIAHADDLRKIAEALDKRKEARAEEILEHVNAELAAIARLEPLLADAERARDEAAARVEIQQTRIDQHNNDLLTLKQRYDDLTQGAARWRGEMDGIVNAAKALDAALKAAQAAGGGEGPGGGADISNLTKVDPRDALLADLGNWEQDHGFDQALAKWTTGIADMEKGVNKLLEPLEDLAKKLSAAAGAGKDTGTAWAALQKAWNEAAPVAQFWLNEILDPFRMALATVSQTTNEFVIPALNAISRWMGGDGKSTMDSMKKMWADSLPLALQKWKQEMANTMTGGLYNFLIWWNREGKSTFTTLKGWWDNTFVTALRDFAIAITTRGIAGGLDLFKNWVGEHKDTILGTLARWWGSDAGTALRTFAGAISTDGITNGLSLFNNWVGEYKDSILGGLAKWWDTDAKTALRTFGGAVKDNAITAGLELITGWWNGSGGKVLLDALAAFFSVDINKALEDFAAAVAIAITGPFTAMEKALDRILAIIKNALQAWKDLVRSVSGGGNINQGDMPKPPSSSEGAAGPSASAMGLNRLAAAGAVAGSGQTVNITVEGSVVTEGQLAEKLRTLLLQTGRRNGFQGSLGASPV